MVNYEMILVLVSIVGSAGFLGWTNHKSIGKLCERISYIEGWIKSHTDNK